ncbi:MAG: alpha/beta fold hydrolase [Acidimicrobiaceae bacterium]|nr:alpha/beta fold hydrolase [Acidimicrobiaceae bacterium]
MTVEIMPGCEPFSVAGGPNGVLVLHGFTGNPTSVRALAELAQKAGHSVELPRLPGHGTTLEDMMGTTWTDWSNAAMLAYDDLASRCERVVVVGLSMGGALGAWVAEQRAVAGCVFINPLVKPPVQEIEDGLAQLIEAGLETIDSIGSDIKKEGVAELSYPGTPLRCAQSLFSALHDVEVNLVKITAPILLISSREDHVVTSDNGDALIQKVSGPIERIWLENSFHVATMDNDRELVESSTMAFVDRVLA